MREVLRRFRAGELNEAEATAELRRAQLLELGGRARLDLGRHDRRSLPEVVLAEGKAPAEVARLLLALAREQGQGLASRLDAGHWRALEAAATGHRIRRYGNAARVVRRGFRPPRRRGRVGILTAGTSDLGVAAEVQMVVEAAGLRARVVADVGVAGLHRLLEPLAGLLEWGADVLVVAAGMDGVLPGLVAGLVDRPVVGLPVASGYGAGGGGEAALLTMLQSCSTGLTVVNIDNGIGAGVAAVLIAGAGRRSARPARPAAAARPAPPEAAPAGG